MHLPGFKGKAGMQDIVEQYRKVVGAILGPSHLGQGA
jgi:hypothetical protein